jgi:hypothetical protein
MSLLYEGDSSERDGMSFLLCEAELVVDPSTRADHRCFLQESKTIRDGTAVRGCNRRPSMAIPITCHYCPGWGRGTGLADHKRIGISFHTKDATIHDACCS